MGGAAWLVYRLVRVYIRRLRPPVVSSVILNIRFYAEVGQLYLALLGMPAAWTLASHF